MFQRSSLAFYTDITHQNRNRHWCADADAAKLLCPLHKVLPFFLRSTTAITLGAVKLVKNGTEFYDITSVLTISNTNDTGIPVYYKKSGAATIADVTTPNVTNSVGTAIPTFPTLWGWLDSEGFFYIQTTVNGVTVFSETFTFFSVLDPITTANCGVVEVNWSSTKDIGDVVHSVSPMLCQIFVNADEGRPEYTILEEAEEDSLKDKSVIFARSLKQYSIEFLANESLCDALSLMPLCDNINVNNQFGEARQVSDVEISFDWQSDCVAKVKMKYTTDRFVKKNC
jgi:hypothetical protein